MIFKVQFKKNKSLQFVKNHYSALAAILACFFGAYLLFSVIGAGDGMWFFYAKDFLAGRRLFSDLNLLQQPVFILINAIGISVFTQSYIAQKLVFVPILMLYVFSSYLLVNKSSSGQLFKTALFLCFFFTGIRFEAYRFDDYHAFVNMMSILMILIFMVYLSDDISKKRSIILSLAAGLVVTICILTRLNDGLILFFSSMLFYLLRRKSGYFIDLLLFLFSSVITFFVVLWVINENIFTWFSSTIVTASSAKGGIQQLLQAPFFLLFNSVNLLISSNIGTSFAISVLSIICLWCLFKIFTFFKENQKEKTHIKTFAFLALYFVFLCILIYLGKLLLFSGLDLIEVLTVASIPMMVIFCLFRGFSFFLFFREGEFLWQELLLIIPIGLFVSGAMSSGGYPLGGLYFQFALFMTTWFVLYSKHLSRYVLLSFVFLMVLTAYTGFLYKYNNPYSWHSYFSPSLATSRTFIQTEHLGAIPMDYETYKFISPVCKIVKERSATMLSLPFPFANYICGSPVWNGYTQTFFDTTTKKTTDKLLSEITQNPPDLIFYQRQLYNLRNHEIVYNNGTPLPHRKVDEYVIGKLNRGDWKLLYVSAFGNNRFGDNMWLLIDTKLH